MSQILHEDDIETVLQYGGYCLLPIMPYHKAMIFLGSRANGKSTLIELIRRFLGEENTSGHPLHAFLEERFVSADLYGKLANLFDDAEAFFRRLILINFTNRFEGERCDPNLLRKLATNEELSG